ncbi:MAG: hypothetical protein WBE12_16140, partial [Candidatus Acidiferrum sp.]
CFPNILEFMGKGPSTGSPILPTYCLFLLERKKSVARPVARGLFFEANATLADMKKIIQTHSLRTNPAHRLRPELAGKIASLIGRVARTRFREVFFLRGLRSSWKIYHVHR